MSFISYAQNFEDVLLWRALRGIENGFYIDVGACLPDNDSVTRAFYDAGWSGINIEPIPDLIAAFQQKRPRDINLGVAVTAERSTVQFFVIEGTGLSTLNAEFAAEHSNAGWPLKTIDVATLPLAEICQTYAPPTIHFLKIDCEGSERAALEGADFKRFRPWIILVEATKPCTPVPNHGEWEHLLLAADYRFVWFDGLNRFYIAAEQEARLAKHFVTPPNVFDAFIRAAQRQQPARVPQSRPSLADVTPLALNQQQRVELTARCRDADGIPKVEGAGSVTVEADGTRTQLMHNGVKVVADGYYGAWMTNLITQCRGHHEPQEERVFYEVMRHMPATATMIELGGFWAYYTCWFLQQAPGRRAVLLEPDPAHRAIGEANLRLNGLRAEFISGFVGASPGAATGFQTEESGLLVLPCFSVPQLMQLSGFDHLNVLHCDVQGAELDALEGCRSLFLEGRIDWVFVSTHASLISNDPLMHQRCLAFLRECGAVIEAEHDVYESFSGDGLIVARFGDAPPDWQPVTLSFARYSESLFRNPSYDVAAERELDKRYDFITETVRGIYRTIMTREPSASDLEYWAKHLARTGDVTEAIETFLRSEEFSIREHLFRNRYLERQPGGSSVTTIPVKSPVRFSGAFLTLDRECSLGSAGTRLLVPHDRIISPSVLATGAWNPAQVAFIAARMTTQERYLLLDIGANIGLFSRQLVHASSGIAACYMVEPDPENFAALRFNMDETTAAVKHYFNFGLGLTNKTEEFYRDRENCGNYSVHADAMRDRPYDTIKIAIVAAADWMTRTLPAEGHFVWKSDTQGSDEMIVADTPWDIWNRVDVAVLELWRIRKPNETRQSFLDKIASFPNISLGLDRTVTAADVGDYIDGEDWTHEDLYLWR